MSEYRLSTHQKVAYTGTAASSAPFGTQTDTVRVMVTTPAFVSISEAPSATSLDPLIPANLPEYFIVTRGQKISAMRLASDGDLHVTELTR